MHKILVTGTAGFIGFHLADRLIKEGYDVYGLDVINDYYDISLKFARLAEHGIWLETLKGGNLETTPRYNLTPSSSNHSGTASNAPAQVFNIGNSAPVELMAYVEALEKALGKTAKKNFMDIQAGDVPATHADVRKLEEYVNFRPQTSVEEGVKRFVDWYLKSNS